MNTVRSTPARGAVVLVALLAACHSTPVSEQQVELEQQRLLQPFMTGAEVACNELVVEMTANFNPFVSQPAIDPNLHVIRKESRDGFYETVYRSKFGDLSSALSVIVGDVAMATGGFAGTRFTVFNEIRVRVAQGLQTMALDVTASGRQLVMRAKGSAELRDLAEFAVHDGVLRAR